MFRFGIKKLVSNNLNIIRKLSNVNIFDNLKKDSSK